MAAVEDAAPGRGVPVTVKIRAGLRDGDELGRRTAPRLVAAGAAAVCIHPRTAAQLYRGRADHAVTFALAAELPVPVIASGDVDGRAAALRAARRRRRGGHARPRHASARRGCSAQVLGAAEPAPAEKLAEVRRFAAEALAELGGRAVGHLRQFWPKFRRHGAIDKPLSLELMQARDEAEIRALLGL